MGTQKLLLPWGEKTVLAHLVGQWTSLGAAQIAIVLARDNGGLEAELDRIQFASGDRIINPAPQMGMLSSIQCAARWTGWEPSLDRWVIALGDQPHLASSTLRRLLEFSSDHPGRICQPSSAGRLRHPVLLPRAAFLSLASAPHTSLKGFLSAQEVTGCEMDDPGLGFDMDTPEDYKRALALAGLDRG
jgi:molybdenum cofactor cytidylyltransferase